MATTGRKDENPNTGETGPLPLPSWVGEWLGPEAAARQREAGNVTALRVAGSDQAAVASLECPNARELDASELRDWTCRAYRALWDGLAGRSASFPVRCWNFLPGMNEVMRSGVTRYAAFNEGRHAALRDLLGSNAWAAHGLPASTAVGHGGRNLHIAVLALPRPGTALENRRQIPAWQYSGSFGRLPPCFSRGMLLPDGTDRSFRVLISGTASVVGEESRHRGDAIAQLDESLRNVGEVIAEGRRIAAGSACVTNPAGSEGAEIDPAAELTSLSHVRVYGVSERELGMAGDLLPRRCPGARRVEYVVAEICRPELLLEIEGVAKIVNP